MAETTYFIYDNDNGYRKVTMDKPLDRVAYPFIKEGPDPAIKNPAFDYANRVWFDNTEEVLNKQNQELNQKVNEATKKVEETTQQLTITAQQNEQITGMLTKASTVLGSPTVSASVGDKDAAEIGDLWPAWNADGVDYKKGQVVSFDAHLYRVAQDHKSQADWTPDNNASLFSLIAYDGAGNRLWIKPTGAENAYAKDEVVNYNGTLYKSKVDGNVWEPTKDGADQWTEVK